MTIFKISIHNIRAPLTTLLDVGDQLNLHESILKTKQGPQFTTTIHKMRRRDF